jgi:Xaa-Pro aminopeptidase
MQTMQPTLKNGRNVWDPINMPESEFQDRVRRIRREMNKEGIDVLLTYGNADCYGDPCYLTNFIVGIARGALVIVPKKGDVALIYQGPSRGIPFSKTTTWVEDVRTASDVAKECIACLNEKKLIPSTVGYAGLMQFMPTNQVRSLFESLGRSKTVDCDALLRGARMVKSARERDQIRRSARILTRAFDFLSDLSITGMKENALEALVNRQTRVEGSEDFRMLIGKPAESGWAFRLTEDAPFASGERVILYAAVEFERYWAEAIRSFVVEGGGLVEVKPEPIVGLFEQIANGLAPDKPISEFYRETTGKIRKSKLEPILRYGLGQGIGLDLQELPLLADRQKEILKEGMSLALRVGANDPQAGSVMIGKTLIVAKGGPEILT